MTDQPEKFVTNFDSVPEFWQFLKDLSPNDLVTELLVNDIDAGATITSVTFGPTEFVCEGNGEPVDDLGWRRLTFVRGAGDQVPAKHALIGVKNHGLKACFTIGNRIRIRSNRRRIDQTLFAHGPTERPYPGTFDGPSPDPEAPERGCRVEVDYRRKPFEITHGEMLTFPAIDDLALEALFDEALTAIPERFIGVVSPDRKPAYEVALSHKNTGNSVYCGFDVAANSSGEDLFGSCDSASVKA